MGGNRRRGLQVGERANKLKHLIWEKRNQKSFVRRLLCAAFSALMICALVSQPTNVQAATYAFHQPTIAISKPVNFINGDFENPVCSATTAAQHSTMCTDNVIGGITMMKGMSRGGIRLRLTLAIEPSQWQIRFSLYWYLYDNTAANSGNQYAELNTDFASRLYQYINDCAGV